MDQTGLTDAMAEFATQTRLQDIPEITRRMAALSLMDWVAVGFAGIDEPVSQSVIAFARDEKGAGDASVFGDEGRYPARMAALVNGTVSHALDYDDTHFLHVGHPTATAASATFAIAERMGATTDAFLEAFIIAFEAGCRIGDWLGRDHYEAGFHQTATAGAFGAALGAARLLGLSHEECRHVLGLVATRASGLKSQFGTMAKPFNAGIGAANGVEAALLVKSGFISNPLGLECEQGFGPTHHGANRELNDVLDGLGRTFVLDQVSHKFHACCHGIHASIEALSKLRDRHNVESDGVERITLTVNPRWLKVCNKLEPMTGLEAKFSYRLVAAMVLNRIDTSALYTYTDDICRDQSLVHLRDRVEVATDLGVGDSAALVTLTGLNGVKYQESHDLGDPIALDERSERLWAKASGLLGDNHAISLRAVCDDLETSRPLPAFFSAGNRQ
ncbi:MAG: MmgE/PrpD family protein [Pseudomonadota bacterium]